MAVDLKHIHIITNLHIMCNSMYVYYKFQWKSLFIHNNYTFETCSHCIYINKPLVPNLHKFFVL